MRKVLFPNRSRNWKVQNCAVVLWRSLKNSNKKWKMLTRSLAGVRRCLFLHQLRTEWMQRTDWARKKVSRAWRDWPCIFGGWCLEQLQGTSENPRRDEQKQTILDAESILKAADNRNSLISWGRQHTRQSRLSEEAQIRSVPRLELLCATARFQLHLCMLLFWPVPRPDRLCCCVINLGGAPTVFMVVNLLFCFTAGTMLFFANGITPMWTTSLVMILSSKTIMLLQFHSLPRSPVLSRPSWLFSAKPIWTGSCPSRFACFVVILLCIPFTNAFILLVCPLDQNCSDVCEAHWWSVHEAYCPFDF